MKMIIWFKIKTSSFIMFSIRLIAISMLILLYSDWLLFLNVMFEISIKKLINYWFNDILHLILNIKINRQLFKNFKTLTKRKTKRFIKRIFKVTEKNNKTKLIFIFNYQYYSKVIIIKNLSHIKLNDTKSFVKHNNVEFKVCY